MDASAAAAALLPPPPAPKVRKLEPDMMITTGMPQKRKNISVDMFGSGGGASPAPAPAPDADFSDFDDDLAGKKKRKPSVPAKISVPASEKATPRLQACGVKTLDRCVCAARDNNGSHVVVLSLSLRLRNASGADELIIAETRDGTAYDLHPPHERDQHDLGEAEFLGLFYSNVCSPGVGDQIADMLLSDSRVHVIVVDPSKSGDNFARLAVCVAALKIKHRDALVGGAMYKNSLKPKSAVWKNALVSATKCKSDTQLRAAMRELYARGEF